MVMGWDDILLAVAPSIISAVSGNGGNSKVSQQPLLTQYQENAGQKLDALVRTGKFGDYTAGESYGGAIGDYTKSGLETASQGKLASMFANGLPEMYGLGANELKALLSKDSIYDPMKSGLYDSYKKEARKTLSESSSALDKTMAASGNFYSGARNVEQRKLLENTNDALNSKLAQLFDTYTQRRLGAIPMAMNAATTEENMNLGRVNAGLQAGALDRMLKTQQLTDKYNEWKRSREDMLTPIKTATTMLGQNPNWGVTSMSVPNTNPWEKVMNAGVELFAKNFGQNAGNSGASNPSPFTYNSNLDFYNPYSKLN